MSIFEDKKLRMRHSEKGPGKEGSPIGNHGAFFSRDLYALGKLWTKLQLYKKFFPQTMVFSIRLPDYFVIARSLICNCPLL